MPREETEGEPSVDKHGHKFKDIDVPLARRQGFEPWRLGGENRPTEGCQVGRRQAPFEWRRQAPTTETFVGCIGKAGHVWRAWYKQANGTTPESVGCLTGKELSHKGHIACNMGRNAEAAATAPRRRCTGRGGSACWETGPQQCKAGVLPLLNANGEVGPQGLDGRCCAEVAQNDGANGDGEHCSDLPVSVDYLEQGLPFGGREDDEHKTSINLQPQVFHEPGCCLNEFFFGQAWRADGKRRVTE